MSILQLLAKDNVLTLYKIDDGKADYPRRFIASTPETREICNDPCVVGIEYTRKLRSACAKALTLLQPHIGLALKESEANVLNILRGGLNFGLRDALHEAFGWNRHNSSFLSAQRYRDKKDESVWHISEDSYRKVYLSGPTVIFCGDVVASGTSLDHGMNSFLEAVNKQDAALQSIIFFTIGGEQSEHILKRIDEQCYARFPDYAGSSVVYLEGRFEVARESSPLRIKITGTDLLRRDCLMAPEFIKSQSENPAYLLERCTIYDAGSRSFDVDQHLHDAIEYWEQVLQLAQEGLTFEELAEERCPEACTENFSQSEKQLVRVAERQIQRLRAALLR